MAEPVGVLPSPVACFPKPYSVVTLSGSVNIDSAESEEERAAA